MAQRTANGRRGERGFTLAGLIVILTIMMIIVAYTVPRQWSAVLQRDRELQTLFIMKQYAIAIDEFQNKNKALPVNLDQLKQARAPRFLRGPKAEYADPLTGQVDWLIIPASAAGATGPRAPGPAPGTGPTGQQQPVAVPGVPMKDYAGGQFIGVRPNKNGDSLIEVNGSQKYEEWSYTVNDYRNERNALWAAATRIWQ
jgi:type II secretory pathway pseudopilin PulG